MKTPVEELDRDSDSSSNGPCDELVNRKLNKKAKIDGVPKINLGKSEMDSNNLIMGALGPIVSIFTPEN